MATLEDKILGGKLHNYCSSSESEEDGSGDEGMERKNHTKKLKTVECESQPVQNWSGTASNTGPKGVLEDWRRYKQLEAEKRDEMEKEGIALAKKLTLSVRTDREEMEIKKTEELEDELKELVDEEFLLEYQKQRMEELMAQLQKTTKFGKVITLNSREDFLNAIDKEDPKVTIIVHIYDKTVSACKAMDGCLNVLATQYSLIKFCRIAADITGLSRHFRVEGVPALLVYKSSQIIGNFVQLSAEFGDDFFATDVEHYLTEYGMLLK